MAKHGKGIRAISVPHIDSLYGPCDAPTPKEQLGVAAANCVVSRIGKPEFPFVYAQYSTKLIIHE